MAVKWLTTSDIISAQLNSIQLNSNPLSAVCLSDGHEHGSITVFGVGQRLSPRYKTKRTSINSINNYCCTRFGSVTLSLSLSLTLPLFLSFSLWCFSCRERWYLLVGACTVTASQAEEAGWAEIGSVTRFSVLQLMFPLFACIAMSWSCRCSWKSTAHRSYAHLLNENRWTRLPFLAGWDSSNLQHNANCIVVELLYNWCNVGRGPVQTTKQRERERGGNCEGTGATSEGACVCVNKLKWELIRLRPI